MEVTTFYQLKKYTDMYFNHRDFLVEFFFIGLRGDTIKMEIHKPIITYTSYFKRYISTKGKVLFMYDDDYYTEQELVEEIKIYIDKFYKK